MKFILIINLYENLFRVVHKTHFSSITKLNLVSCLGQLIIVCSQNSMKPTNVGELQRFLMTDVL